MLEVELAMTLANVTYLLHFISGDLRFTVK